MFANSKKVTTFAPAIEREILDKKDGPFVYRLEIPRVFPRLSRFFTCVKNLELSGDFGGCTHKKPPRPGEGDAGGGRAQRRAGLAYFSSLMAACAAARRAIGTRKGEQET